MTGREERQQKVEERILNKLKAYPEYMVGFYYSMRSNDNSENTNNMYINAIINFLEFLRKENYDTRDVNCFKNVNYILLCRYVDTLKYKKRNEAIRTSASFQIGQIKALKAFFKFLLNAEYIEHNPTEKISYPKADSLEEPVSLSIDEIQRIKYIIANGFFRRNNQWQERDKAIIMLFLRTGMRISEIVELNVSDIDFCNHNINVIGKGNKRRRIPIDKSTLKDIENWIVIRDDLLYNDIKRQAADDALFISNHLTRISDQVIRRMVNKVTEMIGHKVNPHKLRSTYATHILEKTENIYVVAALLGHSSPSTTKRYAKINDKMKADVASLLGY